MAMKIHRSVAVTGGLALLALVGVGMFAVWPRAAGFSACNNGVVMSGKAAIGGPFTLVDENGRTVTDKDVITKPTLIYFGYSHCTDVCPLDEARNADVVQRLSDKGYDVGDVFITVDPARDTAASLKEWTDYFSPSLVGLTGSPEQIAAAARQYRVQYSYQGKGKDYEVSHPTFTYLMFPGLGFVELFSRDEKPAKMAKQVECYLDAA